MSRKQEMKDNIYSPDYVKRLFDRMSSSYERMNYITSFGFSIRWRTQFLSSFEPTDEKVEVMDFLTGMGETWAAIRHRLPNSKLTVLDFSEGMLKYAKSKSQQKFQNEVIVLQQDILQNQLPSNYFDFITCAFGLKTFDAEHLHILAIETKRILKQGGQFSFIEVSKPDNKLLQMLYSFYLGQVMPILGRLLLSNPTEYKMLWKYTIRFENAKKAAEIFAETGLKVEYNSYFYGCATGFFGQKING